MTPEPAEIERHIAAVAPVEGVAGAFRLLATEPLAGFARHIQVSGFVQHDLRFMLGDRWLASAALNPGWVLIYLRRPAFRTIDLRQEAVLARFPQARVGAGEVKLRLTEYASAREVLALLSGASTSNDKTISQ